MVIRRRNGDRVDLVAHRVEHLAVVGVQLRLVVALLHLGDGLQFLARVLDLLSDHDVRQRHHLEAGVIRAGDVGLALAAGADARQGGLGQLPPGVAGNELKTKGRRGGRAGEFAEGSTGKLF